MTLPASGVFHLSLLIKAKFEITKTTDLSDIAPCSVMEIDRRLRRSYYFHHQGDDWGSDNVDGKHLWDVGQLLPLKEARHFRRWSFLELVSYSS